MSNTKYPLWAPYVEEFSLHGKTLHIKYKGGEVECKPEEILSIMIYGNTPPIAPEIMEFLVRNKIPLIIHRRNLTTTVWVTGANRADNNDVLSRQILVRKDQRKKKYIARQILNQKFHDMAWLLKEPQVKLNKGMDLKELRNIEANHSQRYWEKYFKELEVPHFTRREKNPISEVLDAASKFISGILLRWIHYHHMSPFHGFLHEMTDYPALVFDLIEPHRSVIDKTVFELYKEAGANQLLERTINALKNKMNEQIFCPQTKQIATYQELLHGMVLSLRSYFLGETRRYSIPISGKMNGGRPQKNPWRLYGRKAGITKVYLDKPQK